jgi:hypothetical protein
LIASVAAMLSAVWLTGAQATGPKDGKAAKLTDKVVGEGESCGNFGTSVHFVATPSVAAKQALKEEKLVFVLHVSGLFEDPTLT